MSLLFDLIATQPIGDTKYHGGGEYTKAVFRHLVAKESYHKISCIILKDRGIDKDLLSLAQKKCDNVFYISNVNEVQDIIEQHNISVFFSGLPLRYANIKLRGTRFIFTIHGLRPIELRTDRYEYKYISSFNKFVKLIIKNLGGKYYTQKRIKQFEKLFHVCEDYLVITDSNHSYYAILSEYNNLVKDKLIMLYCPILKDEKDSKTDKRILEEYELVKGGYFLLINANRWEKNSYRAVKAFRDIYRSFPDFNKKIVLVGAKNSIRFQKQLRKNRNYIITDYLHYSDLNCLYRNAFCFVYPTLNEGFGYPPLICMKNKVPVIASAVTSVTEVVGQGALYFNPYSKYEIKNRILQVYYDDKIRKNLCRAGIKRIEKIEAKQRIDLDNLVDLLVKRV